MHTHLSNDSNGLQFLCCCEQQAAASVHPQVNTAPGNQFDHRPYRISDSAAGIGKPYNVKIVALAARVWVNLFVY
jgi:hypothetical protein